MLCIPHFKLLEFYLTVSLSVIFWNSNDIRNQSKFHVLHPSNFSLSEQN